MILNCNFPINWIMKSALLQHGSNWASFWLFKKPHKTCSNTTNCIQEAPKLHYPDFTILNIFIKHCQICPQELPGSARRPHGTSDGPDKHQNQCQWTHNHVKLKIKKSAGISSLNFAVFYNGCNDIFLTLPPVLPD